MLGRLFPIRHYRGRTRERTKKIGSDSLLENSGFEPEHIAAMVSAYERAARAKHTPLLE
jgi:hypothetical protein